MLGSQDGCRSPPCHWEDNADPESPNPRPSGQPNGSERMKLGQISPNRRGSQAWDPPMYGMEPTRGGTGPEDRWMAHAFHMGMMGHSGPQGIFPPAGFGWNHFYPQPMGGVNAYFPSYGWYPSQHFVHQASVYGGMPPSESCPYQGDWGMPHGPSGSNSGGPPPRPAYMVMDELQTPHGADSRVGTHAPPSPEHQPGMAPPTGGFTNVSPGGSYHCHDTTSSSHGSQDVPNRREGPRGTGVRRFRETRANMARPGRGPGHDFAMPHFPNHQADMGRNVWSGRRHPMERTDPFPIYPQSPLHGYRGQLRDYPAYGAYPGAPGNWNNHDPRTMNGYPQGVGDHPMAGYPNPRTGPQAPYGQYVGGGGDGGARPGRPGRLAPAPASHTVDDPPTAMSIPHSILKWEEPKHEYGQSENPLVPTLQDHPEPTVRGGRRNSRPSPQTEEYFPVIRRRAEMKPRPYDGSTPWEEYHNYFLRLSQRNGWAEEDRLEVLLIQLQGEAQRYIDGCGPETQLSFASLDIALQQCFGVQKHTAIHRTALQTRVRKEEEDLPALAQDIRHLVNLAYPDFPAAAAEVMAIDRFTAALDTGPMRKAVYDAEPLTLDMAIQVATREEAWTKMEKPHCAAEKATRVRFCGTSPERGPDIQNQMKEFLDVLTKSLRTYFTEQPRSDPVTGHNFSHAMPSDRGRGTSPRRGGCYRCGQQGHFMHECPFPDSRHHPREHSQGQSPHGQDRAQTSSLHRDEKVCLGSPHPRQMQGLVEKEHLPTSIIRASPSRAGVGAQIRA